MIPVLVLGAGKIGGAIAKLLSSSGDYDVLVGDVDELALKRVANPTKVKTAKVDVSSGPAIRSSPHAFSFSTASSDEVNIGTKVGISSFVGAS